MTFQPGSIEIDSLLDQQTFVQQDRCLNDIREVESAIKALEGLAIDISTESLLISVPDLLRSLSRSSGEPSHRLASTLARRQKVGGNLYKRSPRREASGPFPKLDDKMMNGLKSADHFGRLPLHYAAESGLLGLCRLFLEVKAKENPERHSSILLAEDVESNTPLHLSIIGGHVEVTEYLVEAVQTRTKPDHPRFKKLPDMLGSLSRLAARANFTRIVRLLVDGGASIDHLSSNGETLLHIAARNENTEMIRFMQDFAVFRGLVNIQESTYGRTALLLACIGGFDSVVGMLIQAGADPYVIDARGWTAKEHAAFHGHLRLL